MKGKGNLNKNGAELGAIETNGSDKQLATEDSLQCETPKQIAAIGAVKLGRPKKIDAIDDLFTDFKTEKPLSSEILSEIEEALTESEKSYCFDTLATMKMKALHAERKPVQAYNAFIKALKTDPKNLSLQLEIPNCLGPCHNFLINILNEDPENPLVEPLYQILKREAYLNPITQISYLKFLILNQRFQEALQLALPLVELFPTAPKLYNFVTEIVQHAPHERLTAYLQKEPVTSTRRFKKVERTTFETLALKKQFGKVREMMSSDAPVHLLEKEISQAIGDFDDESEIDVTLKDFYFLLAIVEEKKENYLKSFELFNSLYLMDPVHFYFRNSRDVEATKVLDNMIEESAKPRSMLDLTDCYNFMKQRVFVPYEFLKTVCLQEAKQGKGSAAKFKMRMLVQLNSLDGDYVAAALEVAQELRDEPWIDELYQLIVKMGELRPWDLAVAQESRPESSDLNGVKMAG